MGAGRGAGGADQQSGGGPARPGAGLPPPGPAGGAGVGPAGGVPRRAGALACRTALLPGGLAALTRALPADALISYGPAPRNTLTLSSLDGQRASVAVQREFLTLDGRAVERQELILPYAGEPPELLLAQAGAALLLGRLPPG